MEEQLRHNLTGNEGEVSSNIMRTGEKVTSLHHEILRTQKVMRIVGSGPHEYEERRKSGCTITS